MPLHVLYSAGLIMIPDFAGLKALALVVRINPSYAMGHQEVVIECLEHEDLTIQQRVSGVELIGPWEILMKF